MSEQIIEKSSSRMYLEDMVQYSIIVNRRRAFPDVRDGLKPVQRRVIYSMLLQNAIGRNTLKSARVTGQVMGLLHPHCLKSTTVVYSIQDKRLYTFQELYENKKSITIYSIDSNGNRVEALAKDFRIGQTVTETYKITLSNGFIFEATGNHPIMNINHRYIAAEDLKVGDLLYTIAQPIMISNIEKILYEIPEPMYDFTVEEYENMLIPTGDGNMICVHNSSSYGTLVVLANWYSTKFPLIHGQGNFGNVSGDGAAAERYTEISLSDFCYDCIVSELKTTKYVVDWKDNYDRSTQEPEYLPVRVPLLLLNGSFGIGVGMSVNIPPHNLSEVIAATRNLIKNPDADVVLIPDHCQPLEIIGNEWKKISHTGVGKYKVRGIIEISDTKGYPTLTVKSLPDNVSTEMVKDKLLEMVDKKQLPMVKDILDASKDTVDLRVILKKGTDPYYVKQVLYTKAMVQGTVSVNFEAINDINPVRLSYKQYLQMFLEQRATIKFRLYCNKLKDASTRYHKLDAYIKIIESGEIDKVVSMIKKQKTVDDRELCEYLIKKLNITDLQAQYILDTDIKRLSKGYLEKYKSEYKQLTTDIEVYKKAVTDDGSIIMKEIDQELAEIEAKYHTPRICKVLKSSADDLDIPKGTFKVIITEKNYIRKIPDADKISAVKGDIPKFVLRVDNAENILLFDNMGKVFKLPIFKIPVTDHSSSGTDIRILIRNLTADIIGAYYEPMIKDVVDGGRKHYVMVATKFNIIKKLDIEDFLTVNPSGLMYTKLKDGDTVVGVDIAPADLDIVIYSKQKALRTHISEIPLFKRNATGSKAMATDSIVEGISVIYPDAKNIIVLTANGKANKFDISGLASHGRARVGINVIKLKDNDSIFSIYGVSDNEIMRIVTTEGVVNIPVNTIPIKSSIAAGEKLKDIKGSIVRCDIIRAN